ncbi:MAG: cell wall hydrolase [Puniceicoccaceae bacterium]
MKNQPLVLCAFLGLTSICVGDTHQISNYGRQIIASVLILEAADQGVDGMQAVLNVIDNRANGNPAKALGQVARRKAFTSLNSVTSQRNPDYSPALRRAQRDHMWQTAMSMVDSYSRGHHLPDLTRGATHYCIDPPASWQRQMTFTVQIGAHNFFRE